MARHRLVITDRRSIAARLATRAERALDRDIDEARACLLQLARLLAADVDGSDTQDAAAEIRGGLPRWQVRRVIEHIDANLGAPIPVSALAAMVGLSSGHFCRVFKASVGETPHAFITARRIEHAQTLMLVTSDTLSQIAAACGLSDQAHLTRLFGRHVGITPHAWRRAWRERAAAGPPPSAKGAVPAPRCV